MRQKTHLFIPVILLLFVASCVQLASEEVAPTQVGNNATWTPLPTETVPAAPTATPTENDVVIAQVAVTEEILVPTDPALVFDTITPIPTNTPTATPTATFTATATATATPTLTEVVQGLVLEQEGTAIAQDDAPPPVEDPNAGQQNNTGQVTEFEATATALIVNATQTQDAIQTQTQAAILGEAATPTPPVAVQPTEDPLGVGTDGGGVAAPIPPGADCVHEVRTVDQNLYRLSLAYGVPIRSIRNENGSALANPDLITLGQRLLIPGCGTTGGRPPATSTPGPTNNAIGGPGTNTSASIAPPNGDCSWGTSVEFPNGCLPENTTTSGSVGTTGDTTAAAGTGGPGTVAGTPYTVEQGDTLSTIALQFNTTPEEIAAANGLGLESTIFFNQVLIIPQ